MGTCTVNQLVKLVSYARRAARPASARHDEAVGVVVPAVVGQSVLSVAFDVLEPERGVQAFGRCRRRSA